LNAVVKTAIDGDTHGPEKNMRHRTRNRPPIAGGDLNTILNVLQVVSALAPIALALYRWWKRPADNSGLAMLGAKPSGYFIMAARNGTRS
jgi:hypothetical protein